MRLVCHVDLLFVDYQIKLRVVDPVTNLFIIVTYNCVVVIAVAGFEVDVNCCVIVISEGVSLDN